MNIIWITPELPWPANTGGRIGIFKRIERFSKNNNIYLFSIIDSKNEEEYLSELKKYCHQVNLYCRNENKYINYLKCMMGPYICTSRWKYSMRHDIEKLYNDEKIDYIIVDFPQMLGNISSKLMKDAKIILNQHNLEVDALVSNAQCIKNKLKRKIYLFEASRLKRLENNYYKSNKIALYTFVSKDDKEKFEARYQLSNTLLVPVGIDINDIDNIDNRDNKCTPTIVFIGKMSYPSNIEGALWFVRNVWPGVLEKNNKTKLYIVGKDPVPEIRELECENIIVTGTVDSVKEYYEMASLVIIPLLSGGGVKIKLMEAFSYKKMVISTSKGIEGTDFVPDEHLLVSDTPEDFRDKCISYLNNPYKYQTLIENSYNKAIKEYSWDHIVGEMEQFLHQIK